MHHVSARREDLLALANLALQVQTRTHRRAIRFDALDDVQRSRRVRGKAVYLVGVLLIVTRYWLDERKSGGSVFSVTVDCTAWRMEA
jgi:hypothetical protein